jgi:guanine deaminase
VSAQGTGGAVAAVRGHAISFRADPFREDDALIDIADALIIMRDSLITHFGAYDQLKDLLPAEARIASHPGALICPGFIDGHVHYAQARIIGSYGEQLTDWLAAYPYAEEQRFADPHYAALAARVFFDQLLANGTTTALTFCATYPASVDAFFAESERRGTRMIGGKVLMDRNAPDNLLDTARSGYDDSRALIDRWHGRGRSLYAITPRFAPTSTPEQLELAGALLAESPGTFLHTHVSESRSEVAWVRSLFPERAGYLDVYDHYGLLRPRSVLAHGVHLTARERRRVQEAGAAITHCPTSNLFLGSGLFRVQEAKDPRARPRRPGH